MPQTDTRFLGTRLRRSIAAAMALGLTLVALGLTVGVATPRSATSGGADEACEFSGATTQIATAKMIIEYNATDQDIGVHGTFDDQGWSRLCVFDPTGREVLRVSPKSQLADLTMAGIFFESREPPIEEFDFNDLKNRFPEGRYQVRGQSFDGTQLVGSALFTHDVPRPPKVTAPLDGATVSPTDVTVRWNDVTKTIDGGPVDITGYEVIVTKEQRDDPHGFSRPTYDVHVPANRNSLSVPAEFFQPRSEYELEVLALEKSGNQTISVSFFKTR